MRFREVLKHEDVTHCPRTQDYSSKWHSLYSHVDVGQNFEATEERKLQIGKTEQDNCNLCIENVWERVVHLLSSVVVIGPTRCQSKK